MSLDPDPAEVYRLRELKYVQDTRNAGSLLGDLQSVGFLGANNNFNTSEYLRVASSDSPADVNRLDSFNRLLNFNPKENSILKYIDENGEEKRGYIAGFDKTSSKNENGEILYTPLILTEKGGVKVVTQNRTADSSDSPMLMTSGEIGELANFQIGAVASAAGPVVQGVFNANLSEAAQNFISLNYGQEAANNLSPDAKNKAIQALIIAGDQANPGVSKQLDEQVGNSIESSPTPVATVPTVATTQDETMTLGGPNVPTTATFSERVQGIKDSRADIVRAITKSELSPEDKRSFLSESSAAQKAAENLIRQQDKLKRLELTRNGLNEQFERAPDDAIIRRDKPDIAKRLTKLEDEESSIREEIQNQNSIINNFNAKFSKTFNQQSPLTVGVVPTTGESAEEIDKAPILNQLPAISGNSSDEELRDWYKQYEERGNYTPDQLKEVQGLLNDLGINSVKEVGDAVNQGRLTPAAANKSLALIAALMSQNDPTAYMNLYQGMLNQANYGDPSISAKDALTARTTMATTARENIIDFRNTVIEAEQNQNRTLFGQQEGDYDQNAARRETNNAISLVMNSLGDQESINKQIARFAERYVASSISAEALENPTIADFISDIFKKNTITGLDLAGRLRVRRDARGRAAEIVFVNPSNPKAETELSATASQVVNELGGPTANLLLRTLPTLGE